MLIEPVALSDFFMSFFSAAMIILSATLYAGLIAWGKTTHRKWINLSAWIAYAFLLLCVGIFSTVNHFTGYWLILSVTMVIGYAFMPHAIWHLCVATHADESENAHHSGDYHD